MEGGPEGGVCGCVSSMAISSLSREGFTEKTINEKKKGLLKTRPIKVCVCGLGRIGVKYVPKASVLLS